MDAKNKANFINSVASGNVILCQVCGAQNAPDSQFCGSCGAEFNAPVSNNEPAFAQVSDNSARPNRPSLTYQEPESVFADGLPNWDIVPPQVMVR